MTGPAIQLLECTFSLELPKGVEFLVKKGEKVEKGKVLAVHDIGEIEEFNLAELLGVPPKKVGQYLVLSLDSKVEKDQPVAAKKTFLGKEIIFKSPVGGTLVEINDKGVLRIKTIDGKKQIHAPLSGIVKEIGDGFLSLEFKGKKINGEFGKGPKVLGVLEILAGGQEGAKLSHLGLGQAGKVLAIFGTVSFGICHKAEALGVAGLLGGLVPTDLEPVEMAALALGNKDGVIDKEIWQELEMHDGQEVLISGEEKYVIIPVEL